MLNFILRLKHTEKHFTKMLTQRNLLTRHVEEMFLLQLLYLGNISSITKTRLTRCISNRLKFCKLRFICQASNRLKDYFRSKVCFPETMKSNIIYRFNDRSCTGFYHGKPTDIWRFGFQNTRVCLPKQVSKWKVLFPR